MHGSRDCVRPGEVARELGVLAVRIARAFRERHGVSVGEYGRRARIEWAAAQVAAGDRPLAEIAVEAGFVDQSHFTRLFRALPRDDAGPVPTVPEPLDVQDSGGRASDLASDSKEEPMRARTAPTDGAPARASRHCGRRRRASSPRRAAASTGRSRFRTHSASRSSTSRSPSRPGSTRTARSPATSRTTRSSKRPVLQLRRGRELPVVYDGDRAKIGGEIKTSNDPTLPPGGFAWFQVFDLGEGANALPGPPEPDRLRRRGRERGVLQQPELRRGSDRGTSTATRSGQPRRYFAS